MSLIRARQRRKKSFLDARRGMKPGKLMLLFGLTVVLIWFASNGTLARIFESF